MRWTSCWLPLVVVLGLAACGSDGETGSTPGQGGSANAGSGGNAGTAGSGGSAGTAGSGGGSGGNAGAGGSAGTSGSAGTGSASGAAGSGGGASGSGGSAGGEPGVRFVGRMDTSSAEGPRFEWSGSGAVARFSGTSVSVELAGGAENQFTVVIDGQERDKITLAQSGPQLLADDLPAGEHQVEIYRRTEAFFGPTQFLGFDFGGGQLLAPPQPTRRIEVLGDSITCGYGNEGTTATCPFSADTENHYATYAAIAARELSAELVAVAWSGKGVVANYGDDTVEPLPELYGRTLPTEAGSVWDFSVVPDAVVINLGTNDFSTDGDPTIEDFGAAYAAFLQRIRSNYPNALILCTVGPMLSGTDLTTARAAIDAGIGQFTSAGGDNVRSWTMNIANDAPGCDYHPSLATHRAMADALITELRAALGW